jgi:adenylate kinase
MRLIILGPPGAGKGTQAKLIARKYKLKNVSAGNVLRSEIRKKTKIGKSVKPYIEKGDLAPDRLVYEAISKHLKGDFILDGYPRHMDQLKKLKVSVDCVILLDCKKETVFERLFKRKILEKRSDDDLKTIDHRWKIYQRRTLPVIRYFRKEKMLIFVDGNPDIKEVFREICKRLKEHCGC